VTTATRSITVIDDRSIGELGGLSGASIGEGSLRPVASLVQLAVDRRTRDGSSPRQESS
jgi:hypothetical protein